jgi:hypothetical protein
VTISAGSHSQKTSRKIRKALGQEDTTAESSKVAGIALPIWNLMRTHRFSSTTPIWDGRKSAVESRGMEIFTRTSLDVHDDPRKETNGETVDFRNPYTSTYNAASRAKNYGVREQVSPLSFYDDDDDGDSAV